MIPLVTLLIAAPPVYTSSVAVIPDLLIRKMAGTSFKPECPVPIAELRLVTVRHWDLEGRVQVGRVIVAADVAADVANAFGAIFAARFPVARMEPVSTYGGDDGRSMAANNTSAFNCRKKTGGRSWSRHSWGRAIDINPIQNPYVTKRTVEPEAGRAFVKRDRSKPGVIVGRGPVDRAFAAIGWKWGGRWRSLKDYQHFSASGR